MRVAKSGERGGEKESERDPSKSAAAYDETREKKKKRVRRLAYTALTAPRQRRVKIERILNGTLHVYLIYGRRPALSVGWRAAVIDTTTTAGHGEKTRGNNAKKCNGRTRAFVVRGDPSPPPPPPPIGLPPLDRVRSTQPGRFDCCRVFRGISALETHTRVTRGGGKTSQ